VRSAHRVAGRVAFARESLHLPDDADDLSRYRSGLPMFGMVNRRLSGSTIADEPAHQFFTDDAHRNASDVVAWQRTAVHDERDVQRRKVCRSDDLVSPMRAGEPDDRVGRLRR
jgi:hypothetical protein